MLNFIKRKFWYIVNWTYFMWLRLETLPSLLKLRKIHKEIDWKKFDK